MIPIGTIAGVSGGGSDGFDSGQLIACGKPNRFLPFRSSFGIDPVSGAFFPPTVSKTQEIVDHLAERLLGEKPSAVPGQHSVTEALAAGVALLPSNVPERSLSPTLFTAADPVADAAPVTEHCS